MDQRHHSCLQSPSYLYLGLSLWADFFPIKPSPAQNYLLHKTFLIACPSPPQARDRMLMDTSDISLRFCWHFSFLLINLGIFSHGYWPFIFLLCRMLFTSLLSFSALVLFIFTSTLKNIWGCWRDISVLKRVCCSCRGPRFDSSYLHGDHNHLWLQPRVL